MPNHARVPEKGNVTRAFFCWCWKEGKQVILVTSAGLPAILVYEFLLSPHRAENVHFFL